MEEPTRVTDETGCLLKQCHSSERSGGAYSSTVLGANTEDSKRKFRSATVATVATVVVTRETGPGCVVIPTDARIPIRHFQIGHANRYDTVPETPTSPLLFRGT
jgi:hypothetical protein